VSIHNPEINNFTSKVGPCVMSVLGFKVKNKNLGQGLCMHTACMHMHAQHTHIRTFAHNTSSFHIPSYKIFSILYFYLFCQ